eukprot:g1940.t1
MAAARCCMPQLESVSCAGPGYSAFCAGNAFAFDELSGIATFEGHVLFSLDVKTGDLQMQPEESLTKALDAIDVHAVRRKINLQCTILGHYEWLPAGQGPVLTHRLGVELRDQTCWAKKRLSFARRHHKGAKSESDCRSLCRTLDCQECANIEK